MTDIRTAPATSEVAYSHSAEANLVLTAVAHLDGRLPFAAGLPEQIAKPLAQMLQNVGDAMNDDHAIEREHPEHIPSRRWLVHPGYDDGTCDNETWTDALRLARAILGRPDPNAN